jgi:hypothetical protein
MIGGNTVVSTHDHNGYNKRYNDVYKNVSNQA